MGARLIGIIRKMRRDAFFATPLDALLRSNGVKTIVLIGGVTAGVVPTRFPNWCSGRNCSNISSAPRFVRPDFVFTMLLRHCDVAVLLVFVRLTLRDGLRIVCNRRRGYTRVVTLERLS